MSKNPRQKVALKEKVSLYQQAQCSFSSTNIPQFEDECNVFYPSFISLYTKLDLNCAPKKLTTYSL